MSILNLRNFIGDIWNSIWGSNATILPILNWDWAAFFISVVALIIAFRTLNSQEATQKNTTPIMNEKIQIMLFFILIKQYYYKIQYLHVLKIKLQDCGFKQKPEESFIQSLSIIPERYIHEVLFYEDEKSYGDIHWLIKHIMEYNLYVNSVANHLFQKNINPDNIDRLFELIDGLCRWTLSMYQDIFKISKEQLFQELKENLFEKQKGYINVNNDSNITFNTREEYTRNDEFVKFISSVDNTYVSNYYSITNRYMEHLKSGRKIILVE